MVPGDVRYAVRSLRNAPAFTTIALLCLAIGIGANTTMFGVAEHLFLKPPAGIQDPGRVVRSYLERRMPGAPSPVAAPGSYPDYTDLRGATKRTLKDVAAYTAGEFSFGVGPTARQWDGQYVTAGYFGILGTRPELGRFFLADEDSIAGAHPVAVISYGCWQRDWRRPAGYRPSHPARCASLHYRRRNAAGLFGLRPQPGRGVVTVRPDTRLFRPGDLAGAPRDLAELRGSADTGRRGS